MLCVTKKKKIVDNKKKSISSLHNRIDWSDWTTDGRWTILAMLSYLSDLDSENYVLGSQGTVTNLPVFIQNILNCVPKTNEAVTGLEQHD